MREHYHIFGHYRGACHNTCNVQYKMQTIVPVVFHNLKKYDGHIIVKALSSFEDYEFNVIAQTMEKNITFSMKKKNENSVSISEQFIDSFQFLPTSLEKLVKNLKQEDFQILKENMDEDKIPLLLRKGVYPYECMDSFSKFSETELPPRSSFLSTLTNEEISQENYLHAQTVWETFEIQTLGDYHNLYVQSDVLQLADVFQNFRKLCKKNYEIDPAHLLTAPGLAWQASLKMNQQPLEFFSDLNMYLFIERGLRGGISTITKRHAVANNKYLKNYNHSSASRYILYLDANNLYGWAMSRPLPYGEFQWVAPESITEDFILQIPEEG